MPTRRGRVLTVFDKRIRLTAPRLDSKIAELNDTAVDAGIHPLYTFSQRIRRLRMTCAETLGKEEHSCVSHGFTYFFLPLSYKTGIIFEERREKRVCIISIRAKGKSISIILRLGVRVYPYIRRHDKI